MTKNLTDGTFAYAMHSNRFLASQDLAAKRDAAWVVCGVPFDGAVTNRTGARMGPQAIRAASLMLCDGIHPHFNVSPLNQLADAGDMRISNTLGLAQARVEIEAQAKALIAKHDNVVFLGGDHSITLALLRAEFQRHGKLALIHFDAHCDTWQEHFGEPSGHGTWVYEAMQEGLVEASQTVQIGLRSSGKQAARDYVADQGGLIYTAQSLRGKDGEGLRSMVQAICQRIGDTPCYLSLDIDCLDPAFAPGTGTPEPGGMTSSQVLTFLEGFAPLHFVGMDCVEVAPAYDHAELTSNAAAHFVWTYLALLASKK